MKEELETILNSRFNKIELITLLNNDTTRFDEAIRISLSDEQPQAWRAAWVLNQCINKNDPRIRKIAKKIISTIKTKEDGHQRELLKLLGNIELTENQEGYLFDICMTIWESVEKSPSVRIVVFRILVKIVKKYPELKNEIEYLTQNHFTESLSPGIKNSFNKLKDKLFEWFLFSFFTKTLIKENLLRIRELFQIKKKTNISSNKIENLGTLDSVTSLILLYNIVFLS